MLLYIEKFISVTADIMTIFGIGGFFTWSFFKRSIEDQNASDIGISIFAYSIKTFLSIVALLFIMIPAYALHFFIILVVSGHYGPSDGFWNVKEPFAYLLAYMITASLFIPIVILTISSIFAWSLSPFHRLWLRLQGKG